MTPLTRRNLLQLGTLAATGTLMTRFPAVLAEQSAGAGPEQPVRLRDLAARFANPPEDAKPWVYWYWMQANVTREGITRDLEAMAETGIGGAYLMSIGQTDKSTLVKPPANSLSEPWWELVVHAATEAQRLGLRLAMSACDGWALAGGPWITPELSMQVVASSTLIVDGGNPVAEKIERPPARENFYQDIAVLAWPLMEGTDQSSILLNPKATSSIPGFDPSPLVPVTTNVVNLPAEGWIQYEFTAPFTCRSIVIGAGQRDVYQLHRAELQVSDDGETFRSLGRLKPTRFHGFHDKGVGCTHAIQPVTARFFRFVIDRAGTPPHSENHEGAKQRNRDRLAAAHIELSSRPAIGHWEGKAGYLWRRAEPTDSREVPDDLCVPADSILDLTNKLSADGTLDWTPPPGRWVIRRIGHTSTGRRNAPAGTGAGLECDKFNPQAARIQFDGWFGEALRRVGPQLAGHTLIRNHTDSWECNSQNWSPVYRQEFIKRRGYDPVPWLPVMNGTPIASADLSERFLHDMRRTAADLVCENFYEPLVKAGRDRGAGFSAECIAPMMTSDGLQHFKYTDVPMGEFWIRTVDADKPNDIMDAICAGHIYGKRIIGAEAFTSRGIHWTEHPYDLKPMGDYNFAKGVNQFMLHVWCHQAFDKAPGITLNATYGTHFGGTQTWHKPGKAWIDYLRRCSAMLQQGLPVADVCYFIGEELPSRSYLRHDLPLPLKDGHAYDCINHDALMTRASVRNGELVLPDGVSYRLLVLPPSDAMTPGLARKIGEFAEAGLPVIATPPTRSIGLTNHPDCDDEVRKAVAASWGKVRTKVGTQDILDELGLVPDVGLPGVDLAPVYHEKTQYGSPPLAWNHRRTKDADLYFLTNQENRLREFEAVFRISGRIPELWDAETGSIRDAGVWRQQDGRTIVPLRLAPAASVFVVFRRAAGQADPVANITPHKETDGPLPPIWIENGTTWASVNGSWQLTRQSGKNTRVSTDAVVAPHTIPGPWTVEIAAKRFDLTELESLSKHGDSEVRHFSGTAAYETRFERPPVAGGRRFFLDLGKVANIAEVTLNGGKLGVLWKPPFVVEVTDALKPGPNELRIEVTNTWKNRLIGDASLPPEKRSTWIWRRDKWFKSKERLEPSGLLGPVKLLQAVSAQ